MEEKVLLCREFYKSFLSTLCALRDVAIQPEKLSFKAGVEEVCSILLNCSSEQST